VRWGLALVSLAACGRIGFGSEPEVETRELVPIQPLSPLQSGDLHLAATATPTGFTVTWALPAMGNMFGTNLDPQMTPDKDWRVTSTRTDYVDTTLQWTGTSLMTTMTIAPPLTFIKRYVPDLSSYAETDTPAPLGVNSKPTYVTTGGRWFYGVVDASVLHVKEISSDGAPINSVLDVPAAMTGTALAGSLAAGADGNLYAMWSQYAGACEWARITTSPLAIASHATVPVDCARPRLVPSGAGALAVLESAGALVALTLDGDTLSAPAMMSTAGAEIRMSPNPAGGFWCAWQDGGELALARYAPPAAPVQLELLGLPGPVAAVEVVQRLDASYLFVAAGQQLWWTQL